MPDKTNVYIVQHPLPPYVVMEGEFYETLDYPTLVKLVYQLRKEVEELKKAYSEHVHNLKDVSEFWNLTSKPELENGGKE